MILPMGSRTGMQDFKFSPEEKPDVAKIMRLAKRQVSLRIERRGEEFHVRPGIPAAFIPAEAGDDAADAALLEALEKGDFKKVTRLYRGGAEIPAERCWLRGEGWCLAYF